MTTPDRKQLQQLAKRWLRNDLPEAERQQFEDWLAEIDESPQELVTSLGDDEKTYEAALFKQIEARITEPKVRRLWPRAAAAASVLLLLSAGIYFLARKPADTHLNILVKNDAAPGHRGATLTLANGQKLVLGPAANGQLAQQAGISITKSADGQLTYAVAAGQAAPDQVNTLTTAKGETYQVVLTDGTRVWLNSASSLTYTADLNDHGRRLVKLSGEGYFEVAKDKRHPFLVETAGQTVEVLGTHFNINSYADERGTATTLLEGSVRLRNKQGQTVLKPGQQALNQDGKISLQQVDTEAVTDWKNGEFYLNHLEFKTALRKIARWYDVEVIYEGELPGNIRSGGWISRDIPLSNVLRAIEASGQVHFRLDGKKLYVTK